MRVGPYEIGRQLGEGGVGRVLLGRAPDGREVAIKVLLRDPSPDALARFAREARVTAGLGVAEGFVPVLDVGTSPELGPYVVFPYVAGGTLRARLEQGRLDVQAALELGSKLARALGRAHALGVVHRDVKPENVLFTRGETAGDPGEPLLADLGLAKHFDRGAPGASRSASVSRTGAFLGTAAYMPWEQVEDPRSVGPAADVFALGAVLYECLAGHTPFSGATVLEHLAAVESGRFEPLRNIRPEVPEYLARAIERALAREPAERFADGVAFAEALAAPAGSRPRPSRALLVALALVLGAGLVAVGSGLAWVLIVRPRPIPSLPVARAPSPRPTPLPSPSSPSPRTPVTPVERDAFAARVRALDSAGDLDGLIREGTLMLERSPDFAPAWAARALGRYGRAKEAARADAEQALALDGANATALLVRGILRTLEGDLTGASADLTRASELDPESRAWTALAEVRRHQGNMAGALDAANRGVALRPRFNWERMVRAHVRLEQGDLAGAIEDATRAIEFGDHSGEPLAVRGAARIRLGDEGGPSDLDQALALDPGNLETWADRAQSRLGRGDARGGVADLDELFRRLKDPPPAARRRLAAAAHAIRSRGRLNLGELAGASEDADSALALEPGLPEFLEARARVRAAQGDLRGALEDMNAAIRSSPDPSLRGYKAYLLFESKDYAGAIAEANRSLEGDPREPLSFMVRGRAHAELGERTEAIADYKRFLELAPTHPFAGTVRAELAALEEGR